MSLNIQLRLTAYGLQFTNGLTVIFLFLAPWQTRWIWREGSLNGGVWEYGTLAIYATEILIWFIAALTFFNFSPSRWEGEIKRGWGIVSFFFIVYLFVSPLWAPAPRVALFGAFHVASAMLAWWIVSASSLGYKKMATAFMGGAVVQALLGIAQVVFQWAPPSTFFGMAAHDPQSLGTSVVMHEGVRFLRAYGGLPHPNILGGYLAVALIFIFMCIIFETRLRHRIMLLSAECILAVGLFFTFSRSAWIALLISMVVAGFSLRPVRNLKVAATMIAIPCIVFAFFGFIFRDSLVGRLTGDTVLEERSIAERRIGFSEAIAVSKSSPLVGVGVGNYAMRLAELAPGKPSWSYQPVHNVPFLILAELGIVGIIFFFIVILNEVKNLRRMPAELALARDPSLAFRMTGSVALLLIIIFLLDHYLWSLYPGLVLVAATFSIGHRSVMA